MRIKLHFTPEGHAAIVALGLRNPNPETLRWTDDPGKGSSYGMGVILRGKSGEGLSGQAFMAMHKAFGAWIEVDSADTQRRVRNALATALSEMDDQVRVSDAG